MESIFTLIDLQDTLDIEPRDDGRIVLHTPLSDVPPEQDLCVRAARALQNFSGCLKGADIRVEKRIPTGGGLGGGSSDAATVLMVLNRLWDLNLPSNTLQKIGLTLGADVPFFLFGQSAFARGIGEILTPLALPPQWYVLVRPNVHVATPKVFAHPDLPRDSTPCAAPSFAALQPFRNDMQAVVLAEYPPVAAAFRLLQDYGNPRMTGSGACLFLAFDNAAEAEAVLSRLPETLESWCVAGLAEHPLRFQAA